MVGEGSQCPSDPPCDTLKEASLKNDSKYLYYGKVLYKKKLKKTNECILCLKESGGHCDMYYDQIPKNFSYIHLLIFFNFCFYETYQQYTYLESFFKDASFKVSQGGSEGHCDPSPTISTPFHHATHKTTSFI